MEEEETETTTQTTTGTGEGTSSPAEQTTAEQTATQTATGEAAQGAQGSTAGEGQGEAAAGSTGSAEGESGAGAAVTEGEGDGTGGDGGGDAPAAPPAGFVAEADLVSAREALTAAEARAAESETARTSAELLSTERETRIGELETQLAAAVALARSTEINSHARALGFIDPADAAAHVAADVPLDKIGETLAGVAESKSYLVAPPASVATTATSPARTVANKPTFTQAQISDRAFWNEHKAEIMLAMREGRIAA